MIATFIDGYVFVSQALYRNYSRPSRSANSSSQRASVWQDNYCLWKVPDTNCTVWLIISKRQQATPNNNVSCSTSVSQASHVYHTSTESWICLRLNDGVKIKTCLPQQQLSFLKKNETTISTISKSVRLSEYSKWYSLWNPTGLPKHFLHHFSAILWPLQVIVTPIQIKHLL